MADIIEHICGPDESRGLCYYCGRETERSCYTCGDKKYVCPDDLCQQKHEQRQSGREDHA